MTTITDQIAALRVRANQEVSAASPCHKAATAMWWSRYIAAYPAIMAEREKLAGDAS